MVNLEREDEQKIKSLKNEKQHALLDRTCEKDAKRNNGKERRKTTDLFCFVVEGDQKSLKET